MGWAMAVSLPDWRECRLASGPLRRAGEGLGLAQAKNRNVVARCLGGTLVSTGGSSLA